MIVADGVKLRDGKGVGDCKFRSGMVTKDAEINYRRYLKRIEVLINKKGSALYDATLLVLEQRHGFAHALRRGMVRVKTPFVLVAQHDRSFVKAVDLENILPKMHNVNVKNQLKSSSDAESGTATASITATSTRTASHTHTRLNYVGFPTGTTITHAHHVRSKYALEVTPFEVGSDDAGDDNQKNKITLLPLVQFYDSMHVASTRWYLSKVFGRERYCTLPKGGFIEDTLGQMMLKDARACRENTVSDNVSEFMSQKYGVFVRVASMDDPGSPVCGHIDGRDLRLANEDNGKFWFKEIHTSEETWGGIERGMEGVQNDGDKNKNVAIDVLGFFDPADSADLPNDVWI